MAPEWFSSETNSFLFLPASNRFTIEDTRSDGFTLNLEPIKFPMLYHVSVLARHNRSDARTVTTAERTLPVRCSKHKIMAQLKIMPVTEISNPCASFHRTPYNRQLTKFQYAKEGAAEGGPKEAKLLKMLKELLRQCKIYCCSKNSAKFTIRINSNLKVQIIVSCKYNTTKLQNRVRLRQINSLSCKL